MRRNISFKRNPWQAELAVFGRRRKGGVGKEGGCGDILRNDTGHVRRGARCGGKIMQWRSWPDGWFYGTPSPKHYDYYYSHYHHSHLSPTDIVRRHFAALVSLSVFLLFCFGVWICLHFCFRLDFSFFSLQKLSWCGVLVRRLYCYSYVSNFFYG